MNINKKDQPYTSQLKSVAALLEDSVYPTEDATTTLHTISIDSIKLPNSQPRQRYENTLFLAKGIRLVQRGGMEDHTPPRPNFTPFNASGYKPIIYYCFRF